MISAILIGIVAAIHLYIVYLEMFQWDKPAGRKVFGTTQEFASASKVLAANQGLYNGFLAAGLIFGLFLGAQGGVFTVFFLCCVIVAGIFGAATVNRKILFVQAVPAAVALVAVLAGY
ncbi:DUF1304 domain-containing protein [Sulfitobacter pseudonitzschiae]|uniref:DUF1304 domain-containing protein n=1 Tax=Pseudosulfitobacter pseudonitzschiae TaxID=1402135 RepID=A0A9Q2NHZ9_9RHOB|nr:DUF1304 domain-containing protein [Pseudosulfitobacter pseudonitzschiae]MBM2291077.1 DUF1304 domain-containing protein [Pseudosulfitobacter pseudonitzschiae]MBM2295995.1 DUF1304 domain-containing protein [Pseudosulfitobacter pseudonitzschiae]MBM2300908.1 DUF1304 domain-containing protein [Pseudosulfitobacter pseudonitzschiae]MBM2310692.1 DUF1304 domain-containing protein [Pseudosulfitobacter pseudonitzschiae]MBM2315605.1 DUF1304 domain-containing protein [Pseudosulfitobacter pseudonitzschia